VSADLVDRGGRDLGAELFALADASPDGMARTHSCGWTIVITTASFMPGGLHMVSGKRYDHDTPSPTDEDFLHEVAIGAGCPRHIQMESIAHVRYFVWGPE